MTDELLGMLTVLVTTNFAGVTFAPVPCTHPGCVEGHHSYTATERYMVVRDTWAEVVGTGTNRRLYSDTNDWGSLSHPVAHPAAYFMHTQPGWAVRPGTRWPLDLPPLPPWEASERVAMAKRAGTISSNSAGWLRRSTTAMMSIPPDTRTAKAQADSDAARENALKLQFGVLYNVTSNVLEKRSTDRGSGVRVWEGDGVIRYTIPPTSVASDERGVWITGLPRIEGFTNTMRNMDSNPVQRFRAVPATNALPRSRRFAQ